MTGYQKLKAKEIELEDAIKILGKRVNHLNDALLLIAGLKGPELIRAPQIAIEALQKATWMPKDETK